MRWVHGARAAGGLARRRRLRDRHRLDRAGRSLLLVLGLAAGLLLVLPVGGADVPIVISLLNAFTGLAVAASGVVLGNVLLRGRRHPGRGQRNHPDPGDGRRDGPRRQRHHVRRVPRRLDGRLDRAERPAGAVLVRRGRRGAARLRAARGDRARLRTGRRAGPAHGRRARHARWRPAASRWPSASTRSPAGCPGT